MTKLTRPVRREVSSTRFGTLMVTLHPQGVDLREKGRRTSFLLPWGTAYQTAVVLAVTDSKRERRRRRAS